MSIIENILKKVVLETASISDKAQLSPSVYKIQLKSERFKAADFELGYFLRLGVGIDNDTLAMKDKVRSYSVWDIDKTKGTIDLAIATESRGIGAHWVMNCKVGETVYFKWKKGNFLLDLTADSYLMIGDVSALSHMYMLNRHLPEKQVESIIYSDLNHVFEDTDGSNPFNFYNLKPNAIADILKLVNDMIPKMKGNRMVYIAGDSRVCVALNAYFKNELQWNTKQIKTKPFWNPDKKGLE
ncbi:siderophore-interacting protein [Formosa sp. 3Alg 14/1]|uniref:siderophore-interacting protein n=1 Tax=Formosa sp. 3Alg 14/1 TaxID=3382190 RepID=UPI0039BE7870